VENSFTFVLQCENNMPVTAGRVRCMADGCPLNYDSGPWSDFPMILPWLLSQDLIPVQDNLTNLADLYHHGFVLL
jgi:hypothetical protein